MKVPHSGTRPLVSCPLLASGSVHSRQGCVVGSLLVTASMRSVERPLARRGGAGDVGLAVRAVISDRGVRSMANTAGPIRATARTCTSRTPARGAPPTRHRLMSTTGHQRNIIYRDSAMNRQVDGSYGKITVVLGNRCSIP